MDDSSTNGTTRNVVVIRATPAQTAVLKKEFAISDTPTTDQIKALSEQTTLPPKWIHNWFGRQRTKANKSKPKADRKSYMGPNSLDSTFSPQEVLRIKREHADTDDLSKTSLLAQATTTSISDYAIVSASSSGNLDASVTSEPPRKRRGRPPQKKTSPPRNLRSSKRMGMAIPTNFQPTHVKAELIESSGSLDSKSAEDDLDTQPAPSRINPSNLTSMSMAYRQLVPSVAPPKRSPITAAKNKPTGSRIRNARSGLSANQPNSIYATSGTSSEQASARDHATQARFARIQKRQKAAIPPGPVFHTQFQNNVPEDFASSRMPPSVPSNSNPMDHFLTGTSVPIPSLTVLDASLPMIPQSPLFNYGVIPLAPVFEWETHSPSSGNVAISSNHGVIPDATLETDPYLEESQPYAYYSSYNCLSYSQLPYQSDIPQNETTTSQSRPELINTMLLDAVKNIIDPSLAPLKYLTDVLGGFKDEQGTYLRLLAHEERDNLLKCLLDESLAQNSPFQAAMALSLLSKLGFEWNY